MMNDMIIGAYSSQERAKEQAAEHRRQYSDDRPRFYHLHRVKLNEEARA